MFLNILCCLIIIAEQCLSARILGIAPLPSLSHHVFYRSIWENLADRGHDLVVLTTDPTYEDRPNIREIDLHFVYERKRRLDKIEWTAYNWLTIMDAYQEYMANVIIDEFEHPEVQGLLKNETEHFDLVICEMHLPIMFSFAHRFKCPLVGISSSDIKTSQHAALGNPTHPLIYPEFFLPQFSNGFFNRLLSVALSACMVFRSGSVRFKEVQVYEKIKKHFGADLPPPLESMLRNISLVLLNIHPIYSYRPLGPKFIAIGGGTHAKKTSKILPQDLLSTLDESQNGVVYFSFGTNVKSSQYPKNLINITVNAFKELPFTLIWKFHQNVDNLPKNVKIVKWVPQNDLLRHKNTKAFITQAGIHSMEESILAKVPMIAVPFRSDQDRNAKIISGKGIGLKIDKNLLSENVLRDAVLEVVKNPKYKERISEVANLLNDTPMTGLEKATWWIEYVLRHRGSPVIFENPNIDIPMYQYLFIDVIGFLILFTVLVSMVVVFLIKGVLHVLRKNVSMMRVNKEKLE